MGSFEQTVAVAGVEQDRQTTDAAYERETVISYSDGDKLVRISTTRRGDITSLLKNPSFVVKTNTPARGNFLPFLEGTLPFGAITFRKAGKGQRTVTRTSTRVGMPANAARCQGHKLNGEPCGALANALTGVCARHKDQAKVTA